MGARVTAPGSLSTVFVPNGESRRDTAILLVGTASEYDISQRSIRSVTSGFYVTQELASVLYDEDMAINNGVESSPESTEDDVTDQGAPDEGGEDYYDPADYTVSQVKEFVEENPELASDILASEQENKARSTLVEWLAEFEEDASGNRAAKNDGTADKE